jgi:hypothetical protein
MSQQSDMADVAYQRVRSAPLPIAHLVRELRGKWGADFGVSSVHGFIREVVYCLLVHDDVLVGDIAEGRFVAWALEPSAVDQKIDRDLMSMSTFLDDETRYVFQKK